MSNKMYEALKKHHAEIDAAVDLLSKHCGTKLLLIDAQYYEELRALHAMTLLAPPEKAVIELRIRNATARSSIDPAYKDSSHDFISRVLAQAAKIDALIPPPELTAFAKEHGDASS